MQRSGSADLIIPLSFAIYGHSSWRQKCSQCQKAYNIWGVALKILLWCTRIWGTVSARRFHTGIVALEVAEVSDTY